MRLVAAIACAMLPAPALAQAYQCRLPDAIAMPAPPRPDGPPRRTAIAGYVLAVSWAPEYCRGPDARDPANPQCNGRMGRFGFVLHGLWPEAAKGPPPQWCALTPRPTEAELRAQMCRTPVPWLIEHSWAKHGSCMAARPADYFRVAAQAWSRITPPDADRLSRREGLSVGALREAFVLSNPGWRADAVGVLVSNSGWLRELRLCLDKAMRPRRCPGTSLGPPENAPLKIWRGL